MAMENHHLFYRKTHELSMAMLHKKVVAMELLLSVHQRSDALLPDLGESPKVQIGCMCHSYMIHECAYLDLINISMYMYVYTYELYTYYIYILYIYVHIYVCMYIDIHL